jgi:hypothetical protein
MNDEHKDALQRYEQYADADRHNIDDAVDDLRHAAGDQWDENVRRIREERGQPVITINKSLQFINQVAGDMMQSQPAIDIVGADNDQDPVYAEIMGGLIRQIEYASSATSVYNWGSKCQITCGVGHWQIATEYADDSTFDQDIRIRRINDPLSVVWDESSIELDRSDAMECFVSEMVSQQAFKRDFKSDKLPTAFPESSARYNNSIHWADSEGKSVRIASHWRKVKTKKKIGQRQDGKIVEVGDMPPDMWASQGILKVREVDTYKIMHRRMSGDEYLEDEQEWAGKFIPIVPVIGNEISVGGRIIRFGLIRHVKDPQRLYNYFRSAAAEMVALQPKAPYLVPLHSVAGLEDIWRKANSENLPYLPYNVDPAFPNLRPQREAPPQPSAGMLQEAQIAENDMYGTTGIYPTSLGQKSNESSGRAIMAREKQSDTGTYVYPENFKASIKRTGDILCDLIPRVIDSTRSVRILGADGLESMAKINMIEVNPITGEQSIVNDLSAGKFDVRIKVGNNYANAKERESELIFEMLGRNPNLWNVVGDLAMESLEGPGAAKLAARIKKTMPAELVGEGGMQSQPNPAQEAEVESLMLGNEKTKVEIQGKQIENMGKSHELGVTVATAGEPDETAQSRAA